MRWPLRALRRRCAPASKMRPFTLQPLRPCFGQGDSRGRFAGRLPPGSAGYERTTSRAHGKPDLGRPLRSPRRGPRWRPRPAPFALESGLLWFDCTWTRAKSPRAEDDRFGCDTRAATCGGGLRIDCTARAPLDRAKGRRRSGRASLLGRNTVGVVGLRSRGVR